MTMPPFPAVPKRPAVFLDKDGTLVIDVPYNVDPSRLQFTPGALPALQALQAAGYLLVIVSNQPGLGSGRFSTAQWQQLEAALLQRLALAGVHVAAVYHCPHVPGDGCGCRKPAAGLLRQAALEHPIDLAASWMVGDILDDVEAGQRAGCRAVLLDVGHETLWAEGPYRTPVFRATDLGDAARYIMAAAPGPAPSPPRGEGWGEGSRHTKGVYS